MLNEWENEAYEKESYFVWMEIIFYGMGIKLVTCCSTFAFCRVSEPYDIFCLLFYDITLKLWRDGA